MNFSNSKSTSNFHIKSLVTYYTLLEKYALVSRKGASGILDEENGFTLVHSSLHKLLELLKQLQTVEKELDDFIDNPNIPSDTLDRIETPKKTSHQPRLTPKKQNINSYTPSTTLNPQEVLEFITKTNEMYEKDYVMKKLSFQNVIKNASLDEKEKPALHANAHFALWSQEPVIDREYICNFKVKVQRYSNEFGIMIIKEKNTIS